MRRRIDFIAHTGMMPVLVMLVVFALIGFAALSVSSARTDRMFSDVYAARSIAYYEGVSLEQEYLAVLHGRLAKLYEQSEGDPVRYFAIAGESLQRSFPCGEGQSIELVLRVLCPEDAVGPYFEIISEKTVNEEIFTYETPLHILGSEAP